MPEHHEECIYNDTDGTYSCARDCPIGGETHLGLAFNRALCKKSRPYREQPPLELQVTYINKVTCPACRDAYAEFKAGREPLTLEYINELLDREFQTRSPDELRDLLLTFGHRHQDEVQHALIVHVTNRLTVLEEERQQLIAQLTAAKVQLEALRK